MASSVSCGACGKSVVAPTETATLLQLTCNGPCGRAFHATCAAGSKMAHVPPEWTAEPGWLWFCPSCREDVGADRRVAKKARIQLPDCKPGSADKVTPGVKAGPVGLPEEIWMEVFQHLKFADLMQIRLVSGPWKAIVDGNRSLLAKINLNIPKGIAIDQEFKPSSLLPCSTITFKSNTISSVEPWWSSTFGHGLTHLVLDKDCRVTLAYLLEMLRQVPNLGHFNLQCGSGLVYDASVEQMANFCLTKMKTFEIDSVTTDQVLTLFGRLFPRLQDLTLSENYKSHDDDGLLTVVKQLQDTLEAISLKCSTRVLVDVAAVKQLKRISVVLDDDQIPTESLVTFAQRQPLLESLDFDVSESCGEIGTFLENLTKLKRLSLTCAYNWTYLREHKLSALTELEYFSYCAMYSEYRTDLYFADVQNPKLTELVLVGSEPSDLEHYIDKAPNLRAVTIEDCILYRWSDFFTPSRLQNLRSLKLNIIRLKVGLRGAYSHDYSDLAELRYLYLTDMPEVMLVWLFRSCPRVELLRLCCMWELDENIVLMLLQKLRKLRELVIDYCPLSDAVAKLIIKHGGKLEKLRIDSKHSCKKLSSEVRENLLKSFGSRIFFSEG